MARAQGARGFGPVGTPAALAAALREALDAAEQGAVCVIDARVLPGYDASPSGPASHKRG
jgi:hypothetical protein